MSQLLEDALSRDGVAVTRAACPEAASAACAACLAAGLEGLDRKLALPQTMAERMRGPSLRHFVPVWPACAAMEPMNAALRAALAGEAGALLVAALGRDAELRELQVIVSEPGAAAQDVHSDSNWGTERLVTMFIALHDVLDERMGPTRFWPNTHAPRCFPGEVWRPPTELLAANLRSVWYALHAGDAVLMDACTWHRGGANTSSGTRRTLLAASFVASSNRAAADGEYVPRLGDFLYF